MSASEDGGVKTIPRRIGRPKKNKCVLSEGDPSVPSPRRRGRPKKSSPHVFPGEVSWEPEGIMTRARRALAVGKRGGVVFKQPDDEVIQALAIDIAAQYEEFA